MGQEQSKGPSKGELLYQQVSNGNAEEIKALHREGAGLEWLDREGKTPLIVACMNHELYNVAKTLIELGANVNAYSPAEGNKASGTATSANAKPAKAAKPAQKVDNAASAASEKKGGDCPPEKDRKKDVPQPCMQYDDKSRVEKAKHRAVVKQTEARNRVELFRHLPQCEHRSQLPDFEAKFFHLDSVHPAVYKVGLQHLFGDISGGNARCIAMLQAFQEAIKDYRVPPEKTLGRDLTAEISRHGGTPLHHAAKMGLDSSVWLLLLNGANPLVLNDDCQTALEIARAKKHTYVVRAIESHLCLFSGWLREFLGSGFLEVVAPQLVSRKVWVVVLPVRSWNLTRPYKLELAIYSTWQDAHPRTILALWKAYLEPKLRQSDPTVTIVDTTAKTHVKLGPANENDKQQLAWFSFACKGIPHANPVFLHNNVAMAMAIDASIQYAIREKPPFPDAHPSFTGVNNTSIFQAVLDSSFAAWKMLPKAIPSFLRNNVATVQPTAAPAAEDPELTMAINASMQHAIDERPPFLDAHPNFEAGSSSGGVNNTSQHGFLGTPNPNTSGSDSVHEAEQGGNSQHVQIHDNDNVSAGHTTSGLDLNPSAPPIGDEIPIDGPIHYPSIDLSPVEVSSPAVEKLPKGEQDAGGSGSSCVICLDAPAEGACIPCGHVAGCMSCLNEVKTKKWGCPVCRAKIDQVIKLYHV